MTQSDRFQPPPPDPAEADLHDLARDWIALWQSELAALATDREAQEAWRTLLALWAGGLGAMLAGLPGGLPDEPGPRRRARANGAARPAAPAAAPDAGDAEVGRLRECIAELERRLAELERDRR